jgi:uncharacterized protein
MVTSMSDLSSFKPPKCPLCRKASVADFRPFCSRGCKDRDLLKWLGGDYAVPAHSEIDDPETLEDDGSDDDS